MTRGHRDVSVGSRVDRRAAEVLGLELAMLARAYGLNVAQIVITAPSRIARAQRQRIEGRSAGRDAVRKAARRGRRGV